MKRIKFWNQFFTTSQIRIKFFKIEQSFVQLYTTRQLLYRKIYSVSEFKTSYSPHIRFGTEILTTQQIFEWNWFRSINFSWTNCFQKISFLSIYTVKMSKLTFSQFLRKLVSESDVFGKKHALNRKLWEKNRFWWKFSFQTIIFGSFYPTKCQLWQLCVFSKTNRCLKKWKRKQLSYQNFGRESDF